MKLYDNLRSVLIPSGYKSGQIYPQKQLIMNNPAYWFNNATAGNFVSTPNAVANQITGDIDIIVYIDYIKNSTYQGIVCKNASSTSIAYNLYFNGTSGNNRLELEIRPSGSTIAALDTYTFSNTFVGWVRVSRVQSSGITTFYRSTEPVTTNISAINWIVNSTAILGAGSSFANVSTPLLIGTYSISTLPFQSRIYKASISNTIGGTPVVDFNPNDFNWNANMLQNGQTFTSRTTGEVWTITSTGQGYIIPYLETIPLTRGSAGTRSLPSGVIESMAANMPRLDSPLNGCPGILMEPQRTKLVQHNTDFLATGWIVVASAVREISSEISPIQGQAVCKVTTTTGGYSGLYRTISGTSNNYTITTYVKKGTLNFVGLIDVNGLAPVAWFNIGNGTLGTINAGYIGTIEPLINGFYKITLTRTGAAQIASYFQIFFTNTNGSTNGAVGETHIAYADIEVGNFSSSPIVTAASTVTRLADTITPASYHFIGLGNKGTIVVDYTLLGLHSATGGTPFMLVDNLNNTAKMYLLGEFSNGLRVWDYLNSVYYYNVTQTVGTRYKVLFKWDNNYGCCYVNGVKIFEKFDSVVPYYFNYIRNLFMTTNSIRLNELLTDTIAVSHLDCIKLTT